MNTIELANLFHAALLRRGLDFRLCSTFGEDSGLILGMKTSLLAKSDSPIVIHLSSGATSDSAAVMVQDLSSGKKQAFGFAPSDREDPANAVERFLDESPDLLAILRGEIPPNNDIDWDGYK